MDETEDKLGMNTQDKVSEHPGDTEKNITNMTPNMTNKGQFTNDKSPIGTFRATDSKGGITPLDNIANGTHERDNYNDTMKQTY